MLFQPRIIAFYLPQFHPIPQNDKWWGKGFTEWYNVGNAKPLFPGHKQPKVPTDLGYYDLRVPEVREQQAKLAREAGVEGFCYWHYWFGDKKQLLERPLQEVVRTGKPDFPFCLAWANEDWYAKQWNSNGTVCGGKRLIEQKYNDYNEHFYEMLPIFKDKRYMKVDGRNIFMVYHPSYMPNFGKEFILRWQELAQINNLPLFHFVAHAEGEIMELYKDDFSIYLASGYDAIFSNRFYKGTKGIQKNILYTLQNILLKLLHIPRLVNFNNIVQKSYSEDDKQEFLYPGIICGWDHTPRSGRAGVCIYNFNKKNFSKHIESELSLLMGKLPEHEICFLKSWNEWGEGNFMEPDVEFGHMKLDALKQVIIKMQKSDK